MKKDINLVNDFLLKSPDLYIRKYEYMGEGVLHFGNVKTATLTPKIISCWDSDIFNSTVADNLYLVDDDNNICFVKIDKTLIDSIVFDLRETKTLNGVCGNFTYGQIYQFQILSPHDVYAHGAFMGYIGEGSIEETTERVVFKYGVPRRKQKESIINDDTKLTAKLFSTEATLAKAIKSMVEINDLHCKARFSRGFTSPENNLFQITMVAEGVDGKQEMVTFLMGKFSIGDSENLFGDEYKSLPFEFTAIPNDMFPMNSNLYLYCVEKERI